MSQANRVDLIGIIKNAKESILAGIADLKELYKDFTAEGVVSEHIDGLDEIKAHESQETIKGLEERTTSYNIPLEEKGFVQHVDVSTREAQIKAEQKQRAKQIEQEQKTRE